VNRLGAVWIDGKQADSGTWTTDWSPSGQQVVFGFDVHGMIDDVRLFSRVLADAEITSL